MPGLFRVELSWLWQSKRVRTVAPGGPQLPEKRSPTLLDEHSASVFLEDALERDVDGYGRFLAVFGVDTNAVPSITDESSLKAALTQFSRTEEGPIRIVIVQIGDSVLEHIFVPHKRIGPVERLFEAWGINESAINWKLSYKTLFLARLESLFKLA